MVNGGWLPLSNDGSRPEDSGAIVFAWLAQFIERHCIERSSENRAMIVEVPYDSDKRRNDPEPKDPTVHIRSRCSAGLRIVFGRSERRDRGGDP
jgi:hypothetical protein